MAWRGKEKHWIWLVIALNLRGVYSRSSDLRCLSSSLRLFSGQPSSLSLFCTRMLGGSWEPEATLVLLGYLSSCSSSMSCFLLFLGLLSLCCFWSAVSTAQSAVMFDSTFSSLWGSSVVCVGDFENTIVPYRRPPKLHFVNFHINYPLDLLYMLWEHGREKYKWNFSQRDYHYSMNTKFMVWHTNTYAHTYRHTYIHTYIHTIQTPLAFNTLM